MKNTILFFFLLLAACVSAQSNSFVTDRLRAAEYLRIGTNTSQKVTGFDRVITAPGTHDSLPTSRAIVDFLEANFTPIGYYTAGTGISISDDVITNAAPDQTVTISGVGITPSGTYPNFTLTAADQSATNELQNLSLSGQSLGISSGTGVTLPVVGVTAGTGIGVSSSSGNFTVSNTGDLSTTNELNTSFSVSGSNLALTDAGGTINVPVSSIAPVQAIAAGSGISISGTTTRTITATDVSGYTKIIWVDPLANASLGRIGNPNRPVRTIQAALDSLYNLNGLNDSTNLIILMPGRYVDNAGQLTGRIDSRGKYCNVQWMPGAVVIFNQYFTRYDRPVKVRLTGSVNYINNENTGIANGNTQYSLYIKGVKGTTGTGPFEYTFEGPYVFRELDTFIVKRTQSYDIDLGQKQNWYDKFGYLAISGGLAGSSAAALYSDSYSDPVYDKSFYSEIENFNATNKYAMISRTGFGSGYVAKRCSYTFVVNRATADASNAADTYHRGIFEYGYNNTYDTCKFNFRLGTIETGRGLFAIQAGTHNNSTIYINANTVKSYYACVYLSGVTFNNSTIVITGNYTSLTEPAVLIQNCTFNNTNIVFEGSFTTLGTNMDAFRISNCGGTSILTIKNSKLTSTGTGRALNSTTANQNVELVNTQMSTPAGTNIVTTGSYTLSGAPQTDAFFSGIRGINLPGGSTGNRATTPTEGDVRKNTTLHIPEYWDGTNWLDLTGKTPQSFTNAAAPNNCIFYSTTDSKLSYKDHGGTVHSLY